MLREPAREFGADIGIPTANNMVSLANNLECDGQAANARTNASQHYQRQKRALIAALLGSRQPPPSRPSHRRHYATVAAIGLGIIITTVLGAAIDEGIVRRHLYPVYGLGP